MKAFLLKAKDDFLLYAFCLVIATSIFLSLVLELPYLYLVPFAFLFVYLAVVDFRSLFLVMLFVIPFTREFFLPGNLGIDIPGEPILIALFFIYILFIFTGRASYPEFFKTRIIQFLIIHLLWLLITVLYSKTPLISLKFFLAKLWFIFPLVFLVGLLFRKTDDFKPIFWSVILTTAITILVIVAIHSGYRFSFENVNDACSLFYRNHVTYSAFISLLMPFIWLASSWYKNGTLPRYVLQLTKIIFLVGVYFSFARGAWMAIFASVFFYYALKKKFIKLLVIPGLAFALWAGNYLTTDHNYMKFAPDFEKAIYHGNIIDHLKATLKNQDISTAERFYRWVAGARMSNDYPATGYGPGSFYHFYKSYTVTSFQTYVSDNPEKSGVHNYFLMTLVEQGVPGLIIFLLLSFVIFYSGVKAYHRAKEKADKNFIAAILCSMVIIYVQLMLSDLIESFKIGVFFFINIALLANQVVNQKNQRVLEEGLKKPAA